MSESLPDVCWFRAVRGLILAAVLNIFPLCWFLAVNTLDLILPWTWFWRIFSTLTSLYTWMLFIPILSCLMMYTISLTLDATSSNNLCKSRFHLWKSLLNRRVVFKLCIYSILSMALPLIYFKIGDESIFYDCQHRTKLPCLKNEKLYVISTSLWVIIYHFFRYEFRNTFTINPGLIPLPVIQQIRPKIKELFFEALSKSIWPCLLSPIIFFVSKPVLVALLSVFYDFRLNQNVELINIGFLLDSWVVTTSLLFTLYITRVCVLLSLVSRYEFKMVTNDPCGIVEGLKCRENSLVRNLAFYDLFLTVQKLDERRTAIYALSQPGGHPYLWKGLSQEVLSLLSEFSLSVNSLSTIEIRQQNPVTTDNLKKFSYNLRSLTEGVTRHVEPRPPALSEIFQKKFNNIICGFKTLPTIQYFFDEITEIQAEQLLGQSQVVVYAVQALADLSVVALTEDRFGVVLEQIPSIITALLSVRNSVELIGRFISGPKKYSKKNQTVRMRDSLKLATQRSLYKIAQTYSLYLNDFPLDAKSKEALLNFVHFREC